MGDIEAFHQGFTRLFERSNKDCREDHRCAQDLSGAWLRVLGLAGLASRAEDFQELPMSLN